MWVIIWWGIKSGDPGVYKPNDVGRFIPKVEINEMEATKNNPLIINKFLITGGRNENRLGAEYCIY
jgi:hypothetical protein